MTAQIHISAATYGGSDQSACIEAALTEINQWTGIEFEYEQIMLSDDTPECQSWGTCVYLAPWNVPAEDKAILPEHTTAYCFFWTAPATENVCWAGGTWGCSSGINNRPMVSCPYNVWWWYSPASWGHGLTGGTAILLHELFNVFDGILIDIYHWPESTCVADHEYGVTVPDLYHMQEYGFAEGDDYAYTQWAFEQLSAEMWSDIAAFGAEPQPEQRYHCTGAPDYECVPDDAGEYGSLAECQADCYVIPPPPTFAPYLPLVLAGGAVLAYGFM